MYVCQHVAVDVAAVWCLEINLNQGADWHSFCFRSCFCRCKCASRDRFLQVREVCCGSGSQLRVVQFVWQGIPCGMPPHHIRGMLRTSSKHVDIKACMCSVKAVTETSPYFLPHGNSMFTTKLSCDRALYVNRFALKFASLEHSVACIHAHMAKIVWPWATFWPPHHAGFTSKAKFQDRKSKFHTFRM